MRRLAHSWFRGRWYVWCCGLLALLVLRLPTNTVEAAPAADFDLSGGSGHFYSQASGHGAGYGFSITNSGGIALWSEFQRLGGVDSLGYPSSQRFMMDGFVVQATQKVILQWRPDANPPQVYFVNVFDKLHDLGDDVALTQRFAIPPQVPATFDAGKATQLDVIHGRLALANPDRYIAAAYYSGNSMYQAIQKNGLPTSPIVNEGPFSALRAQRVVFQHWSVDNPAAGIHAGDVTLVNGGDVAKQLGLVPASAAAPITTQVALATAAPTGTPAPKATPLPTPTPSPPVGVVPRR